MKFRTTLWSLLVVVLLIVGVRVFDSFMSHQANYWMTAGQEIPLSGRIALTIAAFFMTFGWLVGAMVLCTAVVIGLVVDMRRAN